jgi:fibrillarin-like rRNA methylase
LVISGADTVYKDVSGRTLMQIALENFHYDVADFLAVKGIP